jgi:16S rRNA (cytidine1402-2'-O)-methyltransferase
MSSPLTLLQAAAAAAGGQSYPAGALYIVATPIGNLADFSLRAVQVLALADAVACEDTRVSGGLLRHIGLDKPLIAAHAHNESAAAAKVLERLALGQRVAYVSDAGTPAISDPGAALAAAARQAGYRVLPIPGASSVVTALSAAGDAAHGEHSRGFHFAGFLASSGAARARQLQEAVAQRCSTVLFEAPHRIADLAKSLAGACGDRKMTVCRELTKQYEEIAALSAVDFPDWLGAGEQRSRGEFVIVLHALPAEVAAQGLGEAAQRTLGVLMAQLPLKQAVALAVELTGEPRNAIYQHALALKRDSDAEAQEDASGA